MQKICDNRKHIRLCDSSQKFFPMSHYIIHQYFAQETVQRLQLLRHSPKQIALVGADGDTSRQLLAQCYPQAQFCEYDHRLSHLQAAAAQRQSQTGLLKKLMGKTIPQICQTLLTPLPTAQADWVWANLALLHADEIVPVLENWAQGLKNDGLLFFSHFGANTLPEIRAILSAHGITYAAPTLVDMHDLGDMLFHHGFYDPVTDTSQLVLTYTQADTFWQDMDNTGLWAALRVNDEQQTAARACINEAWETGQLSQISLEAVFAHAVKKIRLPENEQLVQFYPSKQV